MTILELCSRRPSYSIQEKSCDGSLGQHICHARGHGQSDPLSPFLFVLAMEALNALFRLADSWGILLSLHAPVIRYRLSLYADDSVIPTEQDLCCARAVLQAFAEASGLCSNISKSQFAPIPCTDETIQLVQVHLPCQQVNFPFRYLGVDRLPSWKAGMLSPPGRTALVKSTLSAIPVHISIAVKLCPGARRDIDKIRRGFIWRSTSSASGGRCLA
jgi:hypothetical protein